MKAIIILGIFSCLVILSSILYIIYGILDDSTSLDIRIKLKIVPVSILFLQIFGFFIHHSYGDSNKAKYCLILSISYIFCFTGDILLDELDIKYFVSGMIMFMLAYILLAISRITHIDDKVYICKLVGLLMVIAIDLILFSFLVLFVNHKIEYFPMAVLIDIYSLFALFAFSCHLSYLVKYKSTSAWLSTIGILIFIISDIFVLFNNIIMVDNYDVKLHIAGILLYWVGLTAISWSVNG